MKTLTFLIIAATSIPSWADLSQIQNLLAHPQVQSAIPAAHLLGVTVNTTDTQGCVSTYAVSANYPAYSCALNVAVNECGGQSVAVGPLNCESTFQLIDAALTAPSFATNIKPLFQTSCAQCHGTGKMKDGNYTDYAGAVAAKDAINQHVVVKKDMPLGGGMSQASRDLVAAWIKAGTPQ